MPHSALRDEKVPQHKLGDRHMISRDDYLIASQTVSSRHHPPILITRFVSASHGVVEFVLICSELF